MSGKVGIIKKETRIGWGDLPTSELELFLRVTTYPTCAPRVVAQTEANYFAPISPKVIYA
jgi:hypothetical protein